VTEITRILSAISQGESLAAEQLLPLVYNELRKLAAQKLAQERPGQTLEATALVHEAYLRLVASGDASAPGESGDASAPREQHWSHRGHFFAACATGAHRAFGQLWSASQVFCTLGSGARLCTLEKPDIVVSSHAALRHPSG
jgi:hypothetical protein